MKTKLNVLLISATVSLAFVLPAWGASDQPAGQPSPEEKAAGPAKGEKKSSVKPHNHLRDAKGVWVPDKKPRKEGKKEEATAAKDAASSQPAK